MTTPVTHLWTSEAFVPGKAFKPKAKADNPTTIDEAFKQCTSMVHKLAKRWTRNHYQYYNDFVSEGHIGICEAWKRFDGTDFQTKGYRFTSYAFMWIRAYMKDFANRLWKNFNNTKQTDDISIFDDHDTIEINTDVLDVKKKFLRLSTEDQMLVQMKTEGETFQTIADELGYDSLHKARNRYIEVCKAIGE